MSVQAAGDLQAAGWDAGQAAQGNQGADRTTPCLPLPGVPTWDFVDAVINRSSMPGLPTGDPSGEVGAYLAG